MVIQETKDLITLYLQELCSFMIYELIMKQTSEEKVKNKKTINFKLIAKEEEESKELDEGDEDDNMAFITKKV